MVTIRMRINNSTYSPVIRVKEGTHKRVHESTTNCEYISISMDTDSYAHSPVIRCRIPRLYPGTEWKFRVD